MEITKFFAQLFGFYCIIIAIVMMIRRELLDRMVEVVEDRKSSLLCGFLVFFLGLITVILHTRWYGSLQIIITLIGWAALIEGILLFGWPKALAKLAKKIANTFYWPSIIISLIIGLYLLYMANVLDLLIGMF